MLNYMRYSINVIDSCFRRDLILGAELEHFLGRMLNLNFLSSQSKKILMLRNVNVTATPNLRGGNLHGQFFGMIFRAPHRDV